MKKTIKELKLVDIDGGLTRMIDRFKREGTLCGDFDEDEFVRSHPAALLLGLLFDQRTLAESAFTGPKRLSDRLGHLDLERIAKADPDEFRDTFAQRPAVHRFTNKMADYTRAVASVVSDDYDGDAARMWNDGASSAEIEKRVRKLPGFGPGKAKKMKYALHYFGFRDFSAE